MVSSRHVVSVLNLNTVHGLQSADAVHPPRHVVFGCWLLKTNDASKLKVRLQTRLECSLELSGPLAGGNSRLPCTLHSAGNTCAYRSVMQPAFMTNAICSNVCKALGSNTFKVACFHMANNQFVSCQESVAVLCEHQD